MCIRDRNTGAGAGERPADGPRRGLGVARIGNTPDHRDAVAARLDEFCSVRRVDAAT